MDILDNKESKNQDFFYSFFLFFVCKGGDGGGRGKKVGKKGQWKGRITALQIYQRNVTQEN